MKGLNKYFEEYYKQLDKGYIIIAYREIISFMSSLKSSLEKDLNDYQIGNIYQGYMDMTYFPITNLKLKEEKLKVAVVFLHKEARFELWLSGTNKIIQKYHIDKFRKIEIGKYKLSDPNPGVDSILEYIILERPNFEQQAEIANIIKEKILEFFEDIIELLKY